MVSWHKSVFICGMNCDLYIIQLRILDFSGLVIFSASSHKLENKVMSVLFGDWHLIVCVSYCSLVEN